jgi:predicted nuclease with TOPRIM domain
MLRSWREEMHWELGTAQENERCLLERAKRAQIEVAICRERLEDARRDIARIEAQLSKEVA